VLSVNAPTLVVATSAMAGLHGREFDLSQLHGDAELALVAGARELESGHSRRYSNGEQNITRLLCSFFTFTARLGYPPVRSLRPLVHSIYLKQCEERNIN
jgi:hypothetical protein